MSFMCGIAAASKSSLLGFFENSIEWAVPLSLLIPRPPGIIPASHEFLSEIISRNRRMFHHDENSILVPGTFRHNGIRLRTHGNRRLTPTCSGRAIYVRRLLQLSACRRPIGAPRPLPTAPWRTSHRTQRTCGLLEPPRLGRSILFAGLHRAPTRVRAPLPHAGALHAPNGGGWPLGVRRERCARCRVSDPRCEPAAEDFHSHRGQRRGGSRRSRPLAPQYRAEGYQIGRAHV